MRLTDIILEDKEVYQLNRILEGVTEEDIKAVHESEKPLLNEALVSIIIGAVMAAPKIIQYIGQVVKFIVKIFKPLKNKDGDFETGENKVSDWIEKQGESLHHKYIHVVEKMVKFLGVAKSVWKDKETGNIDKEKLHLTAEIVLNVAIAVAGVSAVGGSIAALKSGSPIIAAIESGLGGIKGAELAAAIKQIGPKLL